MIYFSILNYIKITFIIYLSCSILDKILLYNRYTKIFYKQRMLSLSIKIWDLQQYKIIFDEIFMIFEIALITFVYILIYWAIPFTGIKKSLVFVFFMFIFEFLIQVRFTIIESNYPKSLFVLSICRRAMSYTLQAILLYILYNPLAVDL